MGPTLPPALARLGVERVRWDPGHTGLRWTVPEDPRFGNTAGVAHGGYLCVVADALLGSSLSTLVANGERSLNPDFHAEFLAPLPLGATLIGEGTVRRHGRTVSFLEATLRREDTGELLLVARSLGLTRKRAAPAAALSDPVDLHEPATLEPVTLEPVTLEPVPSPKGGTLPLWFSDLGVRMIRHEPDSVELEWPIRDHRFDNRSGGVQGGYLAFLADAAIGFALVSGVPEARSMSTTTLSVSLYRPVTVGDTLVATGTVDRRGRRFGFLRCAIEVEGRPVASAQATGLIQL